MFSAINTRELVSKTRSSWERILATHVTKNVKPWPNGVASQRKLGNANLRTQTCDGQPNGIASTRKFNTSSRKAISVQPCTCARIKENTTETNLRRLALGGQTLKNLRSLACNLSSIKVKPWPNGVASQRKLGSTNL